jgi:glutaredoxin 3
MQSVTIYTKRICPYCDRAKALFSRLGVPYSEVGLDDKPDLRDELVERYSWRTVPMIVVGDRFLGGFDDVHGLHQRGELLPILQGT